MFLNLFKSRPKYVTVDTEDGEEKNRRNKILILVIIIAIVVLAFSNFGGEEKKLDKTENSNEDTFKIEQYIAENERRLEEILAAVQGAGKVKAMITVSEINEKIVATDKKTEAKQQSEKDSTTRDSTQESSTVIYGSGAEEKPFVVKEKLPVPSGVVVAATGAGDERVRLELYEAVKALYGLSGHRIKITKGINK